MTACGAVRMENADWQSRAETLARVEPSGARLPEGFDPSCTAGPLRFGAQAFYRVERTRDGEVEPWDIVLAAPGSAPETGGWFSIKGALSGDGEERRFQASALRYQGRISVLRSDGSLEESEAAFPLGLFQDGLVRACAAAQAGEADFSASLEKQEALLVGAACMLGMSEIAKANSAARGLLMQVVQFPSWWTWLVPSLTVETMPVFVEAVPVETPLGPGWRFPLEVRIKGDAALYGSLTVVEAGGVLGMTGGIHEFVGFAPNRPGEPVRVRFMGGTQEAGADPIGAEYEFEWFRADGP
jgi:hypothetical protein